ncbi:MAG: helix-turn-helix domain-containing protein [Gammaproteobacteria bacterium]|nr:helix-turn-helix domain-containing protein [Gammaproteobacteria bacterium]
MSVRVSALVWRKFPSGGPVLLTLLALADWANDQGGSVHPSMTAIARKLRVSESQARRVVHELIDAGWLHVVGNETGGAPGSTRHYRIDIERLRDTPIADATRTTGIHATPTPSTDATPGMNARASTHARDGAHPCAETGRIAMTPNPSIEPPLTVKERGSRSRVPSSKGTRFTIETLPDAWREFARNERPTLDAVRQFQIFGDHWRAQPGQKGVKVDWAATWRNWIRRANDTQRSAAAQGQPADNVQRLRPGEFT